MPDLRRRRCKTCKAFDAVVGPISWRGLCVPCAKRAVDENVDGLVTMTGEPLQRWRRGMVASVGGVLLDDVPANRHDAP